MAPKETDPIPPPAIPPSSSQSIDDVITHLRNRFQASQSCTRIGSTTLISINPFDVGEEPTNTGRRLPLLKDLVDPNWDKTEPCPEEIATGVYFKVVFGGEEQVVVASGECGSGKTVRMRSILSHLLTLSTQMHPQLTLHTQLTNAQMILDRFGSAVTPRSHSSSRFGRFSEVQFDEEGALNGGKVLTYALERERVVKFDDEESGFAVFYDMFAGTTGEEKRRLGLGGDAKGFRYLSGGLERSPLTGAQMLERHEALRTAMRTLGFTKKTVSDIFTVLAGILHLGNLEFSEHSHEDKDRTTKVQNRDVLERLATLFGVDEGDLERALTARTVLVGDTMCSDLLSVSGSEAARDRLASLLYALLFNWLTETINARLDTSGKPNGDVVSVALVDFPGFEDRAPKDNGFEQFCMNYADEKLHAFTMERLVYERALAYEGDGLEEAAKSVNTDIPFDDFRIRLYEGPGMSLFTILDEQTNRLKETGKDATLLTLYQEHLSSNPYFVPGTEGWASFRIAHYNATQTGLQPPLPTSYTVSGFVARNRNTLRGDFISLFANRKDEDGKKTFVAGLFGDAQVELLKHPLNNKAVVAGRELPLRHKPSLRINSLRTSVVSQSVASRRSVLAPGVFESRESLAPGCLPTIPDERSSRASMAPPPIDTKAFRAVGSVPATPTLLTAGAAGAAAGTPSTTFGEPHVLQQLTNTSQLRTSLDELIQNLEAKRTWHLICIRPNIEQLPGRFTDAKVYTQIVAHRIMDIVRASTVDHTVSMSHGAFWKKYGAPITEDIALSPTTGEMAGADIGANVKAQCKLLAERRRWDEARFTLGNTRVFLSEKLWRELQLEMDNKEAPDERRINSTEIGRAEAVRRGSLGVRKTTVIGKKAKGKTVVPVTGSDMELGDTKKKDAQEDEEEDDPKTKRRKEKEKAKERKAKEREAKKAAKAARPKQSLERRCWVCFTWTTTFWIPEWCIMKCGGIKREDVRMAWREKVALVAIVLVLIAIMLFFVEGFGRLLCPTSNIFTIQELAQHKNWAKANIFTAWNGYVYDINQYIAKHPDHDKTILTVAGTDASAMFSRTAPINWNNFRCNPQAAAPDIGNATCYSTECMMPGGTVGCCHATEYLDRRINVYKDIGIYRVGVIGYNKNEVYSHQSGNSIWILVKGNFYDVTPLFNNTAIASLFPSSFLTDVDHYAGQDASQIYSRLEPYMNCMNDAFFVGIVDTRMASSLCNASEYILYGATGVMVGVLIVKFLAALQLGSKRQPENHDRFVILQVPCYTEGEGSLRKTIDSLALLEYDDTRKLLFIIADGMVKGQGNDLSTPELCCKILGVDLNIQRPEAKSYFAIAEGTGPKQHNKAKVYSGLYQVKARAVPFILVVKVGKENEKAKPGNRGKRDSQMILMKFLNKVHFHSPMTPLDLEMYHHIKDIIGVDPYLYEYILMVDADTEVVEDSLNRLVSSAIHDGKIMGICGETRIANEKQSWVTMIQVYEYYISHHMAKAFESLFGSVTCLPGCFSMYRIRTPEKKIPLLIHNDIIRDYEECNVDTLHKKNLLSLGEDRYLTTLMLKNFPDYRNKFTPDALCYTIVPESFSVLLSQRRRWINSTVHNLFELLFIPDMCGCLIFSMRFIVFLDLFATLIMPGSTAYLVFLIYRSVKAETAPTISLVMLAVGYGLQVIIFILKREFQHIGWLIVSILAMPVFSFYLPLYSYWHFDDFRWGNTRMVAGVATNVEGLGEGEAEEKFDPKEIPMQTWEEYEVELKKKEEEAKRARMAAGVGSVAPSEVLSPGMFSVRTMETGNSPIAVPVVHPVAFGTNVYPVAAAMAANPPMSTTSSHFGRPMSMMSGRYEGISQMPPQMAFSIPNYSVHSPGPYYPHAYVGSYQGGPLGHAAAYGPVQMGVPAPYMAQSIPAGYSNQPSSVNNRQSYGNFSRVGSDVALDRYTRPTSGVGGFNGKSTDALMGGRARSDEGDIGEADGSDAWTGGFPSDQDLLRRIRYVLSVSDLQKMTKKKVREELANYFGMDLTVKKDYISDAVERILKEGQ
ncbi:hypothetical protein HDV00_000669 [Rhizophlyctis rosea]|nr:hypothetical protein HDV00_000669 [Rhizophlyctis rosea]